MAVFFLSYAQGHIAPKHRIFYTISFWGVKGRAEDTGESFEPPT